MLDCFNNHVEGKGTKCKEICVKNLNEIPVVLTSEKEKEEICDKAMYYIMYYAKKMEFPGSNQIKKKEKGNLLII